MLPILFQITKQFCKYCCFFYIVGGKYLIYHRNTNGPFQPFFLMSSCIESCLAVEDPNFVAVFCVSSSTSLYFTYFHVILSTLSVLQFDSMIETTTLCWCRWTQYNFTITAQHHIYRLRSEFSDVIITRVVASVSQKLYYAKGFRRGKDN